MNSIEIPCSVIAIETEGLSKSRVRRIALFSLWLVIVIAGAYSCGPSDSNYLFVLFLTGSAMVVANAADKNVLGAFASVIFVALAITWSNSRPTEGYGTYFYSDRDIAIFQMTEQMTFEIDQMSQKINSTIH